MLLLNIILGLLFLALAIANTLLMYHLWGYPYDHERHRSSAPRGLMRIHRATGYAYLAIYIFLMIQMVPRLWTFQVELPARTVLHLALGMSIGAILIIKIAIVRFFKHLESSLVPLLGTGLLIVTFLLLGVSVPVGLREAQLASRAGLGSELRVEDRARVERLILAAELPAGAPTAELTSIEGLRAGRRVLLNQCVQCHDLRTVLVQPRTPATWWRTVQRMGERSELLNPIAETEPWQVTAYLIALSPALQTAAAQRRADTATASEEQVQAAKALESVLLDVSAERQAIDPAQAREAFEFNCSLCHEISTVAAAPPTSAAQVGELIARMVDNGLNAPALDIEAVFQHLMTTYVDAGS